MPVYVDALMEHGKRNAEGCLWCHLMADTLEELHAFAAKIGRKRCWFHRGNHYDLTPSFRAKAVKAGAIELGRDNKELYGRVLRTTKQHSTKGREVHET